MKGRLDEEYPAEYMDLLSRIDEAPDGVTRNGMIERARFLRAFLALPGTPVIDNRQRRQAPMTEDQAKASRCCGPEGCGQAVGGLQQAMSGGAIGSIRLCIGSQCMAWRWAKAPGEMASMGGGCANGDLPEVTALTQHATKGDLLSWSLLRPRAAEHATGYCGLAGKPL
jgi:hypothetical protein